ncbi:hypothetical protein SAMN02745885_00182 [Carboxydocella sporoproducens DSM 16521]|uniref:Uncharacterized protein n=2 Tax=Carboxydocella TaxID=178898 RepID=A0A1T4LJL5_9FIRM|nr:MULTISPECIES: hypothetical protein [Carboxydocella]AVX20492.1 hypothetical protein CFE_1303 [Carboxydocella thermautotrophica]SJZ54821.1 hypothetical protein SAMN02745885_00182 [Carboxydocella sporoproducens DSM 16521]
MVHATVMAKESDNDQLIIVHWLPQNVDYAVVLMDMAEKMVYKPFDAWLGRIIKNKTIRAYHLEHCLLLIDYLACEVGVPIWKLNYKYLKNFLYDYYPKKVIASYDQQKYLIKSIILLIRFMLKKGFKLDVSSKLWFLLGENNFEKFIRSRCKMGRKLLTLKEDLEYLYEVWNFKPSLAIVGGSVGDARIDGLVQMASEIGINVYIFDSIECLEKHKSVCDNNCQKFMVVREIHGVKEIDPIEFIEDVLRDAIGY